MQIVMLQSYVLPWAEIQWNLEEKSIKVTVHYDNFGGNPIITS
jgi:hypothetical protein